MPAQNLTQLFDFEGQFETAAQAVLAANGITAYVTQQAGKLPALNTRLAFDLSPPLDVLTQLPKPSNWPVGRPAPQDYFRYVGTLEFHVECFRDNHASPDPNVFTVLSAVRGKIRAAFMRCNFPFNETNLPFYEIGDIRPAGSSTGWEGVRNVDFSIIRIAITFAILPTAWPAWIIS